MIRGDERKITASPRPLHLMGMNSNDLPVHTGVGRLIGRLCRVYDDVLKASQGTAESKD
jgi:hypothetical protein